MEQLSKKNVQKKKKVPRVPIKTYKWEDIKRSRLKGGYPWTYLYKDPFDEEIDLSQYKMEEMMKSKSSPDLETSSLQILEVTNGAESQKTSQETLPEPSGYIVITELPSDSENHSKHEQYTSLTIQEEEELEENATAASPIGRKDIDLRHESESSDNISQYLDKDDIPEPPTATASKMEICEENGRNIRSKSEEPKRKRKLSIDSSYSRKSLSKLGIIKKLKEARDKIKVPKLNLPTGINKKEDKKHTETKPEKPQITKKQIQKPQIDQKPVYIHIPLKPPEGETDEFSYLEFGEKITPPEDKQTDDNKSDNKSATGSNRSSKIQEEDIAEEQNEAIENPSDLSPLPQGYDTRRFSGHPDEIVAIEILRSQSIDLDGMPEAVGQKLDENIFIVQKDSNNLETDKDDVIVILSNDSSTSSQRDQKSLSRQSSKQKPRAKSAEPERKRKGSLESSYSRKSLSKLAIIQKLKDARDKFKISNLLSRSNSKKSSKKTKSEGELSKVEEKKEVPKKLDVKKNEPKYIHIPLKPPPGQTDEFSYLEFEEKPPEQQQQQKPQEQQPQELEPQQQQQQENVTSKAPQMEEQSSIESPIQTDDVQFIFLTPPSDDEILDQSDVPETPSSEIIEFNVDELKKIAIGAVDKVSPESKRKLETVKEEIKPEEPTTQIENMVVDEEDGLKSTEISTVPKEQKIEEVSVVQEEQIEMKVEDDNEQKERREQELKSSLKNGSPILKKKVSFKRRSKDESKDGIYEDVLPTDQEDAKQNLTDEQKNKLQALNESQSMSVDEEKSYLDEKIIKSTSLEEDYNRWSKISDHEYEPVNPPDDVSPHPTLQINVTDTSLSPQSTQSLNKASSATSLDHHQDISNDVNTEDSYNAQQMQAQLEEKFTTTTPKKNDSTVVHQVEVKTKTKKVKEKKKDESPGKLQTAIKAQADKFKTKLHNIKKPNTKFTKPNLQKLKFEKPKINFPKIPDTAKINLPTFNLTRKNSTKRSLKERQLSTESNVGDSKKHNYFDFSTYPRIFKKKSKKNDCDSSSSKNDPEIPEFATIPRNNNNKRKQDDNWFQSSQNDRFGGRDSIRIHLHAEESFESNNGEDSTAATASHMRYDQDIDIDEAYEKENQEIHAASKFSNDYNNRWDHGSFHPEPNLEFKEIIRDREYKVTDLDSPEEPHPPRTFDSSTQKDAVHSSESSLGIHRRGVLEEIDSDEFFLRQKGISQDNIEIGIYLNSEIREAFKSPTNALSDLQRDQPFTASNQSLPETTTKKKSIKKPKRKKTPHVSQEAIPYDQDDTEPEEFLGNLPPSRPKRRSKRSKKGKTEDNIIPYQETIPMDTEKKQTDNFQYNGQSIIQNLEDEIIPDTETYLRQDLQYHDRYESDEEEEPEVPSRQPEVPPRRNRSSIKSLNFSEHDSILEDNFERELMNEEVEIYKTEHEYIIPTPEGRPKRPSRFRSHSSSDGQESNRDFVEEQPIRPARTRSRSKTRSQTDEKDSLSIVSEPCVEEPCVQDIRDYMGYAIIDKQQKREPPLPPPRTPPRRRKTETKFSTVPRSLNDEPPVRPLRNYSTLGPSRPPRRKPVPNMTDEEKENIENIDITQYIEIEEEPNRDLISGEVIQKMRDRPLPAPPRPPRKTRSIPDESYLDAVDDVTESIQVAEDDTTKSIQASEEEHVISEERRNESKTEDQNQVRVERRLILPTHLSYEETITHGSLVIEPLNGAKILPDSELIRPTPKENIIPVTKDYDDETSEIPEDFKKLKNPESSAKTNIKPDTEVEVLRAHKLQVTDLDVDRLNVNELLANKIIVSDIDSDSINTNEISSRAGPVRVGEIELPPSVLQQLFEKLQSAVREQSAAEKPTEELTQDVLKEETSGQKKTPIENVVEKTVTIPPDMNPELTLKSTQTISLQVLDEEIIPEDVENLERGEIDVLYDQEENEIPEPPVRLDSQNKIQEQIPKNIEDKEESNLLKEEEDRLLSELLQSEVDDPPLLDEFDSILLSENLIEEEKEEIQPKRPPRQSEKLKERDTTPDPKESEIIDEIPPRPPEPSVVESSPQSRQPEVDDEPPPRPPQPASDYVLSQPPASFYALRAQQYVDNINDDIPMVPRRRRHRKARVSRSSSDESLPRESMQRRRCKSQEQSIPELTGQLVHACGSAANNGFKRLIAHISHNVLRNDDGNQDLHIVVATLLILIVALLIMGYGGEKTVHHHHWEYFNPPRDM